MKENKYPSLAISRREEDCPTGLGMTPEKVNKIAFPVRVQNMSVTGETLNLTTPCVSKSRYNHT